MFSIKNEIVDSLGFYSKYLVVVYIIKWWLGWYACRQLVVSDAECGGGISSRRNVRWSHCGDHLAFGESFGTTP